MMRVGLITWRCSPPGTILAACLLPLICSVVRVINAGCPDTDVTLSRHNEYRALHQAPNLVWNDTISRGAEDWADYLAGQGCNLQHSTGTGLGENLAGIYGSVAPKYNCSWATDQWYSEVSYYNFSNPGVSTNASKAIGHFTQVVWKSTTQVGCGAANGTYSGMACQVQVCRYSPPGNVIWFSPDTYAKYRENVLSPSNATAAPPPQPQPAPPPGELSAPPLAAPPPPESLSPPPLAFPPPPPLPLPPPPPPTCNLPGVSVLGPVGMAPWGKAYLSWQLFRDRSAQWIWSYPNASTRARPTPPVPTFVKDLSVSAATAAYLHVIADDAVEVLLNGVRVAGLKGGWTGFFGMMPYDQRPVRLDLRAGTNVLGLRVYSDLTTAGLLASVYGADNTTVLARTDATWGYYNNSAAAVLGGAGMAPYTMLNIRPSRFSDGLAKWIWAAPGSPTSAVNATFIRQVNLNYGRAALLHVIVDGTADVYINGVFIQSLTDGFRAGEYAGRPLSVSLPAGANFITIRVRRTPGRSTAGLLASLIGRTNNAVLVRTDGSWAVLNDDYCSVPPGPGPIQP